MTSRPNALRHGRPLRDVKTLVEGERFVVSSSPTWTTYESAWINGPADGTYGFVEGTNTPGGRSLTDLTEAVKAFIEGFYESGGNRDVDFPDDVAVSRRTRRPEDSPSTCGSADDVATAPCRAGV